MKLNFELVPDGCWYSNLRSILSKEQWDIVRREAYERANGACSICGAPCSRLEAHEVWSYNEESAVQRLENVIAVCPSCHAVIHIGRSQLKGDEKAASEHFMRVNGASYAEYRKALGEAKAAHIRRNKISEWKLDLSYLKKFLEKIRKKAAPVQEPLFCYNM